MNRKLEIRNALRRLILRTLRKLVDFTDDRLHAAEVRLRNDLSDLRNRQHPFHSKDMGERPKNESFMQWEARRSGVAVISKKQARARRRLTASEFDLRFSRS